MLRSLTFLTPQGMVLLYNEIGVSFIATILSVVLLTMMVPPLARKIGPAQAAWSNLTDTRQRLTSSVIRNILPVKLSAYTSILGKKIEVFRMNELVAYKEFWVQMGRVRTTLRPPRALLANPQFALGCHLDQLGNERRFTHHSGSLCVRTILRSLVTDLLLPKTPSSPS